MANSPEYGVEVEMALPSPVALTSQTALAPPVTLPADSVFPPLHEEVVNTITHGLGLLLAGLALPTLVGFALERGMFRHVVGTSIFAITMLAVYAASTLYHGVQHRPAKHFFRVVDHVCIYLLIAGTYTPFALGEGGAWGWTILTLVWLFSALGIYIKIARNDKLDSMSYLPYIALGWLVLVAAKPILDVFPWNVIAWIGGGGFFYTVGVYFVATERRFYHSIWHFFVLAGSACHYLAVLRYLEFSAR